MSRPQPLAIASETAPAKLDLALGPATLAWANVMPLWHRLGRGEGLLFAVNLSLAAAMRPTLPQFVAQTAISLAVLGLLYLVNDVMDAPRDVHDAGKNASFVHFCLRHRSFLGWLLVVEHLAVVAAAWALLSPTSALGVAAVGVVNLMYSAGIKGQAFLDVPWVALWGGLYVMVLGLSLPVAVLGIVGLMTSIAHVFQITRDRHVDELNAIRTSAVARPWLPRVQMALTCAAMGACIASELGPLVGLTAAIPFLFYVTLRSNQVAWMAARIYFGVIWTAVLIGLHAA
jgi:hypothetical protein